MRGLSETERARTARTPWLQQGVIDARSGWKSVTSVTMAENVLKRRQKELDEAYEEQWNSGLGSHHPDFNPAVSALVEESEKASRETEELFNAIVKNDVALVYAKIEEGASTDFEFGSAYGAPERYTPLMCALIRGRYEASKALLRSGADPNYINASGDLAIFWAIDGGAELIRLMHLYGADLDMRSPRGWTPLSYARARGVRSSKSLILRLK